MLPNRTAMLRILAISVFAFVVPAAAVPITTDLGDGRTLIADTYIVPFGFSATGAPAVPPPSAYDGVAQLIVTSTLGGSFIGSSVLIADQWLLTAAHMLDTNVDGVQDVPAGNISVTFQVPSGTYVMGASAAIMNPAWIGFVAGNNLYGNDIALIQLNGTAPAGAQRYGLYTGSGEVGPVAPIQDHAGYGNTGTSGNTGAINGTYGTRRWGQNTYDGLNLFGPYFPGTPANTQLNYDFDNGLAANDAAGVIFGINHLGLGFPNESLIAGGDSGGPAFINGLIAGIHSYGLTFSGQGAPDIDGGTLNSSFGEFAGDTRVSQYVGWIQATTATAVPEPATLSLLALSLCALRARRRKRAA